MAILFLFNSVILAEVRVPHIFSSGMVLQREKPIVVWGWARPGEKVWVSLGENERLTVTDEKGNWRVTLPAMKAGGPYTMTIVDRNIIHFQDILIGDVWLCSGQSNMQMPVSFRKWQTENGQQETAAAHYPEIRFYQSQRLFSPYPCNDSYGNWYKCTPHSAKSFSACGFFFGRKVHEATGVPIGLIDSAYGGQRIETFTPRQGFESVAEMDYICKQINEANKEYYGAINSPATEVAEKWKRDLGTTVGSRDLSVIPELPKHKLDGKNQPTSVYNAMVHPIVPFAIRGVIWYQGESNIGDGMLYYHMTRALIQSWRKIWDQDDLPFYFVQLAPFRYRNREVTDLPEIWEAQAASLAIADTAMVVTNDVGDVNDIHPTRKKQVGERLALCALAKTYGRKEVVYSGPTYRSMNIEGSKIRISFDHVGGGLVSRDGEELSWFEIAGQDRKFFKAKTIIDGSTIVVSSDEVTKPAAVRFAWHQEAQPNLMNVEGLPASAFRDNVIDCYEEIHPYYLNFDVPLLIHIKTEDDARRIRRNVINNFWKADGFPESKMPVKVTSESPAWQMDIGSDNIASVERLDIQTDYQMHSIVYLFHPKKSVNRLLFFHAGHSDSVLSHGGKEIIQFFLDKGFTVAAFWMPLLGENSRVATNVPGYGDITFPRKGHVQMSEKLNNAKGSFLRFFVEPVIVAVNYAEKKHDYSDINMVGISGGGWTTNVCAAIDPRIDSSFAVSGSLPLYLREGPCDNGSFGDIEQNFSEFYKEVVSYPDLYILGGYGRGRKLVQIYNKYDSCCFGGVNYRTFEPHVTETADKFEKDSFSVYLDDTHTKHTISQKVISEVIWPTIK
jgi:sialate O-acetylesterase